MNTEQLIQNWFEVWENGDFENIPVSEDFVHTSPYGTIEGRDAYLNLVATNREKFLGHSFKIHDIIMEGDRACVRYSGIKGDFQLEVSEWHYIRNEEIVEIVAYYNIEGEISEARKLEM